MINNTKPIEILSAEYLANKPFPHIIIDNFFDSSILSAAEEELQSFESWGWDNTDYVKNHQVNKLFTPWNDDSFKLLSDKAPNATFVMSYLNSQFTLNFLEKLTGINDLLADHSLGGGGVHKISTGGKLDVHIDFNWHEQMLAHRRINLLLYLNKNWQQEWGGNLELWGKDSTSKDVDIQPIFNRAVIFNITDESYHGHPIPLNTPPDVHRLSFAMYYFTKERPHEEINPPHYVVWK